MLWRNGAGKAVGALGVASAMAMGAMIGVRALRDRKEKVALAELERQRELDELRRLEESQEGTDPAPATVEEAEDNE